MKTKTTLSDMLRSRRKAIGLSLSQLARLADTSAATLSRYENGWTRFEVSSLRKLAMAMGCRLHIEMVPFREEQSEPGRGALISRLSRLFWDSDFDSDVLAAHPVWVVERVLEYGQLEDVRALVTLLGRRIFLESVQLSRLPGKQTVFWNGILRREGMECMRKSSRTAPWIS